mmetsp:Transcript_63852/g.167224  ORF Transcript_63852/g.167224 Transcript_63852/m.167224 type:complete len:304 (-) Transcript_63852:416-1327(-)
MRSQMPSQPMTMNSSCSVISNVLTSGKTVRICSAGGRWSGFLYLRSPMALERFRSPMTRAPPGMCCTWPPAFVMRAVSSSFSGLWSSERATTFPPRDSTALESPALAQKSRAGPPSFGRTQSTTTAVQPWASGEASRVSLAGSTRAMSSSPHSGSASSPSASFSSPSASSSSAAASSAAFAGSAATAFAGSPATAGFSWSPPGAASFSAAFSAACKTFELCFAACSSLSPLPPSSSSSSSSSESSTVAFPRPPRKRCRTRRGTTMGWDGAPGSGLSSASTSCRPSTFRSSTSTRRKHLSRARA